MIGFYELHLQLKTSRKPSPHRLLCLDPGETTGWALFVDAVYTTAGQLNTSTLVDGSAIRAVEALFTSNKPTHIVCEDYRVYQSKVHQHTNASLHTPRLIGVVETLCSQQNLPLQKRMAVFAKQFVTDDKLKAWNLYRKGERHARDAIRHGCYEILFGKGTQSIS